MKRIVYPLLIAVSMGLAACSTSETQAPIDDRSVGVTPVSSSAPAPAPAPVSASVAPSGPGYYTVAKGDNLYRISLAHGQKVSDLVAWNNLADAAVINEGQVLRVAPPGTGGAAVQTAAVGDSTRDVQPVPASTAQPTAAPSESAVASGGAATAATGATREGIVWAWPAEGKILRPFSTQSKGIDIDGKKGQKVLAAADGRVIYSGTMSGYGNLVIIKHNDELLSAYAHNTTNLVSQGNAVSRGQPVAEMGSSGTDAVKLHFEVRRQGKPDDPLTYLPKR
jgi:lipoprotein NlpD